MKNHINRASIGAMKTISIFKSVSKARFLALLIAIYICIGNLYADMYLHAELNDSTTAQTSAINNSGASQNDEAFPSAFLWGCLASAVVAVVALFVFFLVLRPRIKISPKVAYQGDMQKENLRCEVALINRGLFSCNDIRVNVSTLLVNGNENEKDKEIKTKDYLSMKGVLHSENDSIIPLRFQLPQRGIPGLLRISVLAKHSVSGVEYAYKKVFKVNDFCEGSYEKGKFIQKGNTYKQSMMRENMSLFKWIVPIVAITMAIGIGVLQLFCSFPTINIIGCAILGVCVFALVLTIWQFYIHAKADAYSSVIAYHKIEHIERQMLVAILGTEEEKEKLKKSITLNDRAEDVESEEVQETIEK